MPLGGQDPFISGPKRAYDRHLMDKQRIRSGDVFRVNPDKSPVAKTVERTIATKRELLSGQKFLGNGRENYFKTNQKSVQGFLERMARMRGQ